MKNFKFFDSTIDFLATLIMATWLTGFVGFYYFNNYIDNQTAKEQENERLIASQQELLGRAMEEIDALKNSDFSAVIGRIQEDAEKQIKEIQKQTAAALLEQQRIINELKLPTKYTQTNVNLVKLDSSQVIRAVPAGTRVVVFSENNQWSTVKVGSQEGRILSQYLADNAPSSVVPDLSVIVRQWRPNMGYIVCEFKNASTGRVYLQKTGSGTVFELEGQTSLITNRHVVTDDNGNLPAGCTVKFPGSSHIFSVTSSNINFSKIHDWSIIRLNDFKNHISVANISKFTRCSSPMDGDEVAILGYPSIGVQNDITTTRGIISGRDGNHYITDAKIDVGNSGGAAIMIKYNCYLGIPTFVVKGGLEALGRILDVNIVLPK